MEDRRELTFKILCFNPEVDEKPYYKSFDLQLEKGITILRAINHIKDRIDATIAVRFFCQAGICGSCAVKVNGVSMLGCTTQVWDQIPTCKEEGVIVIDPLSNFKVIKDLVVDIDPMIQKLKNHKAWVVPAMDEAKLGEKEFPIQEKDFQRINPATDCILCASCYSECSLLEVSEGFISPLVMLKTFRMNDDSRDKLNDERMRIAIQDGGIWDCTHCYRCVEVCVKNIPIMDAIQGLRQESMEMGLDYTEGAGHAKAFGDAISKTGRLDEFQLPLKTLGPFGALRLIPFAISMGIKGRVPPIFPHKSKDIDKLKTALQLYRKDRLEGNVDLD